MGSAPRIYVSHLADALQLSSAQIGAVLVEMGIDVIPASRGAVILQSDAERVRAYVSKPSEQQATAFISLDVVAQVYGVSRRTVDRWVTRDQIQRYDLPDPSGIVKGIRWGDATAHWGPAT